MPATSEKLCLVIPTRDRPKLLARLLRYLAAQRFGFPVLVADASKLPFRADVEKAVEASAGLNVTLLKAAHDSHWGLRIVDALSKVSSPYALLCGDDDFVIPEAVDACVDFLERNSDYSLAHGLTAVVQTLKGRTLTLPYRQRSVEHLRADERVRDHLTNYAPTAYSVHRRGDLIRNLQASFDRSPDYELGELLPSTLSVIQGRTRCLGRLFMVRQDSPTSTGKKTSLAGMIVQSDFSKRLGEMKGALMEELHRVGVDADAAQSAVDDGLEKYLMRAVAKQYRPPVGPETQLSRAFRFAGTGLRLLPRLARAVGEGHAPRLASSPIDSMKDLERELQAHESNEMALFRLTSPRGNHFNDFKPIYDLVDQFPEGIQP